MVLTKIKKFLQMVDFEHTLFGLPFAYLGAFLALKGMPTVHELFWITVAMVSARTAALCLNRLIDRKIDRLNPRTSEWVLAKEELNPQIIWGLVLVFFVILFYSAWQLNILCVQLAPLAVIILWLYSYTKRFTWLCHLFLGMAIGIGPIGAWIAVTGTFDWQPIILGAAVAFWIAGFDTMYACQDIQFDRKQNLHSIPAKFGERGALIFSAFFHFLTVIFLLLTGLILNLGIVYYIGVIIAATILIYEHIIVTPGNLDKVNFASFHINRYVGLIIFTLTIIDIFYY